jgi:hypothetical protein
MTDRVIAARAAAGLTSREIWHTESGLISGANSMTDAQKATYMTRFVLTVAAKGIARTIYYQLDHDNMGIFGRTDHYAHWNSLRETLLAGRIEYVNRLANGRVVYGIAGAGMTII